VGVGLVLLDGVADGPGLVQPGIAEDMPTGLCGGQNGLRDAEGRSTGAADASRYWPKPGERSCPLAFARLAGLFAPIRIFPPGDLGQHGELLMNKALMKC